VCCCSCTKALVEQINNSSAAQERIVWQLAEDEMKSLQEKPLRAAVI
jgi:hypothetical protein